MMLNRASHHDDRNPQRGAAFRDGLVTLIKALKAKFPQHPVILNRGFPLLARLTGSVDGVLAESLYRKYDFATKTVGPHFDPARPTNSSPNNTGAKVLPPAQPAFIYWPYGESKEFPMLGQGGRTACAGPVFYFKPEFKKIQLVEE